MRGHWWKIAKLELTLAMKDRESLIWSLAAPIAMAWLFGTMFGSDGPPQPTSVKIERALNSEGIQQLAEDYLRYRGFAVSNDGIVVVFPDSIDAKLSGGKKVNFSVIQGDADATRAQAVSTVMREFAYEMAFRDPHRSDWGYPTGSSPAQNPFHHSGTILELHSETLGSAPKIASGKERMLPAMLIMYIMFQVMTFFLSLWVDDLRTGKIKRIVMSPATPRDLLMGEIAARIIWAAFQVVIILGVGSLLLHVHLNVNWLNFGLLILAFMLAAAAIGMMAASFFKSSEKAGAMGVMISLILAALGGCWWPLEVVPSGMRAVAQFLPTGQAMSAIGNMIAVGPTAPFPAVNIAVLLLMAAVAMPIAARRMRAQLVQ
ncbi:MAG TPA: ABC transporter permease [Candidatus Krumholzibacteria bacterium]|nr:ABC transporter permease [Candidatus Krumholzibacteria bacterium]